MLTNISNAPQWLQIVAVSSGLEGVFYGSLLMGSQESNRIVAWIRSACQNQAHGIQTIFNGANTLLVLLYAQRLVKEVQKKFHFSKITWLSDRSFGILPLVLTVGSAFVIGVLLLDQFHQENLKPGMARCQKIAKSLHVTKLVLNVALIYFMKNRFLLALSLAGSAYSLKFDCQNPLRKKGPSFNI